MLVLTAIESDGIRNGGDDGKHPKSNGDKRWQSTVATKTSSNRWLRRLQWRWQEQEASQMAINL